MSDSARQKRIFLLVLLLFSLFFVVGYTSRLLKKNQMEQEVRIWQARIQQAQQQGMVLQAELAHAQSEAYVHEKAREVLGLVQPDDTLIVEVAQPGPATIGAAADTELAPSRQQAASPAEVPKWQQWLRLFLPDLESAPHS